jgi:hypothetical protein
MARGGVQKFSSPDGRFARKIQLVPEGPAIGSKAPQALFCPSLGWAALSCDSEGCEDGFPPNDEAMTG